GLQLPPPAALDAADLVVRLLVAVGRDRDDDLLRLPPGTRRDRARRRDDLVRQVPVRREVEEEELRAPADHRVADVDEVLPERHLAAREVGPEEATRAVEEAADLVERQLVARLHLPDVARLAAVVAPERQAERQLEREVEAAEVGLQRGLRERCVGSESHHRELTRTRPAAPARDSAGPASRRGARRTSRTRRR